MLKTLEKYKKYVLVIGGSLLMVAFIMPSAIGQMGTDPGKRVVAYVGDTKVRAAHFALAHREHEALKYFAPLLLMNVGVSPDNDLQWYLLTKDAERAGMVGGETDGQMFLEDPQTAAMWAQQLAQYQFKESWQFYWQQMPEIRKQLFDQATKAIPGIAVEACRRASLSQEEFYIALAKLRGVIRMQTAFVQAGRMSDRRLQAASQRLQDYLAVDTVIIPASRVIDLVPSPTEEELKAHFEKYRDIQPGSGDNGIGYRQPDRIKLAFVKVDSLSVGDAIKIDAVEANKRWRKDNPGKPAEEFIKDRNLVEQSIRQEKVAAVMAQVDKNWRALVLAAMRRLPADGLYKKVDPEWEKTRPSLESLAQGIVDGVKASMDITIPLPAITIKDSTWLTARDIQRMPELGQAQVTVGTRSGSAAEVLFTTRELLAPGAKQAPTGLAVQVGIPIAESHAVDFAQNRYYMMVLDARKAAPADSLDEIRDQVVLGYKTLKAYDLLVQDASKYETKALADGLVSVEKVFAIPADAPANPDITPVSLMPNTLVSREQVMGSDARIKVDAFRDEVFKRIDLIDPLKPIADVPVAERTFTMPLPRSLCLVVAQVAGREPLTHEKYRAAGDQVTFMEQSREFSKVSTDLQKDSPFTLDALKARLKFRPLAGEFDETPAPVAAQPDATAPESTEPPATSGQ